MIYGLQDLAYKIKFALETCIDLQKLFHSKEIYYWMDWEKL